MSTPNEMVPAVIADDHSIQFQGFDLWCGEGCNKVLTVIDKLIGAEFVIHTFDGSTPITGFVVPPEHVGELIKKLIEWSTVGSIGIAGQKS